MSSTDFIVNAMVDSSSDDCPVPNGPNTRALDVANLTFAKQIIPKNLFFFDFSRHLDPSTARRTNVSGVCPHLCPSHQGEFSTLIRKSGPL